jgi:hypothetical protein
MTRAVIYVLALMLLTTAAVAHHGWGSYDANKPLTISGPILSSKFRKPARHDHGAGQWQGLDGDARAHLANEHARRDGKVVAVGQDASAYGYPSTVEKDEMRAERITVNGKTYEMRWMTDAAPAIFVALEQSGFAAAIRQSPWLYPAANVGHIVFLVLFAGAIAVMDVRLLW